MVLDSFYTNQYYLQPTQFTTGFGNYGYAGSYSQDAPWLQPTNWNTFGYNSYMPTFGMYNYGLGSNNALTGGYNNSTFGSLTTAQQPGDTVTITASQREAMIGDEQENLAEENKAAKPGLVGALAGSAVFAAPAIANGVKVQRNLPVSEMFFTDATSKLWESHPTTMREAQKVMQKAEKHFQKELAKLHKACGTDIDKYKDEAEKLIKKYNSYIDDMKKALQGTADDVAKVTQHYSAANGNWYKKAPSLNEKLVRKRDSLIKANNAERAAIAAGKTPKSLAVKDNSFFRHMGGGIGLGIGLISGVAMYFMSEKPKVDEAKALAEETGDKSVYRKQLWQSIAKCAIPAAVWTVGDATGRWLTDKFIVKNAGKVAKGLVNNGATKLGQWFAKKAGGKVAGKLCGKIAGKLTGKALGAAIGSIVPGLGTIVGLAIGCVADWAINKWVIPAIFGENDAVDNKKIAQATDEELVMNAYINQKNGIEISQQAKLAIANNPTFCAKVDQLIAQQQQQQNQALYA